MNKHPLAPLLLLAFITLAVFGLYLTPAEHSIIHDRPCPFALGGTALCSMPLTHLEHWQSVLAAILLEVLLVSAIVIVFVRARFDSDIGNHSQFDKYRSQHRVPLRPPPLQELFSQGILHRKEPYTSLGSY